MHTPHYCTPVPDITNECIHGFEERKRLRRQYHSAYYDLMRPEGSLGWLRPPRKRGGVRLIVAPEVMERALDRMAQPPKIVWALHADTVKQGAQHLTNMYLAANVKIAPGEIRRIKVRGRRKHPPEPFS